MPNDSSNSPLEGHDPRHHRTVLFYGDEAFARIHAARVTIVGLGGVGGHAAMNLARSGIGHLHVVDFDEVSATSLNRSPFATPADVGLDKAEVLRADLARSCPDVDVQATIAFCKEETLPQVVPASGPDRPDLVIDAIDSLNTKVGLLVWCWNNQVPVLASLGAAGKRDVGAVRTGDLFDSSICPLAKKVRGRLHRQGVEGPIPAIWSVERAIAHRPDAPKEAPDAVSARGGTGRTRNTLASQMTLPGVFGYGLAAMALDIIARGGSK
ncbi:tRNA threonylcarbamoyladenosine dehydratase [bacterium]|nr:MAG: tRNA threonylcarbamoyladenosine dehydratase [bacterium]